jgi:mono/diheme cytochrome c family protein
MKQLCIATATLCSALVIGPAPGYAQQPTDIGKQEYVISCAVCHGDKGKGDGPLVEWLKKPAADLTKIQKANMGIFPFDRVYQVIDGREGVTAHGPRDMPVWGDHFSYEARYTMGGIAPTKDVVDSFVRGRIIALVGYIYTLQGK